TCRVAPSVAAIWRAASPADATGLATPGRGAVRSALRADLQRHGPREGEHARHVRMLSRQCGSRHDLTCVSHGFKGALTHSCYRESEGLVESPSMTTED